MKNSFILYQDQKNVIDKLTDEQAGKLIKAIYAHECGQDINLDAVLDLVITPFLTALDRDREKYEETCAKRTKAGSVGGKQRVANANTSKQEQANQANANTSKQEQANQADNDNDSDNDSDNDNVSVEENKKEELPPPQKKLPPPQQKNWYQHYQENIGLCSPIVFENIESYQLADEVVIEAINEAVNNDVRQPKYIYAVLDNYKKHNVKTKADVEARRTEWNKNKPKNKDKPSSNAYRNEQQEEFNDLDKFYTN